MQRFDPRHSNREIQATTEEVTHEEGEQTSAIPATSPGQEMTCADRHTGYGS